jgi:hypothetical protein
MRALAPEVRLSCRIPNFSATCFAAEVRFSRSMGQSHVFSRLDEPATGDESTPMSEVRDIAEMAHPSVPRSQGFALQVHADIAMGGET